MNLTHSPGAQSSLRQKLLRGEPLRLKKANGEARIIHSEWISEAAKKHVKIDIRHAIIRGPFNLKDATFEEEVSLIRCRIEDPANLSYTIFKRNLMLYGTTFERGANFTGATVEYDARLDRAEFIAEKASFVDMHVRGIFSAKRVVFGEYVKADFTRVRIDKAAVFWSVTFGGEVDFGHAHIAGAGDFRGAIFKYKTNFNSAKIGGGLFFRAQPEWKLSAASFSGEANFCYVEVGISADFKGVLFKSDKNPVSFEGAKIRGFAVFSSAQFDCGDSVVNFNRARIDGPVFFTGASFASEASFNEVQIAGSADFSGIEFKQKASFNGAKIDHHAFFRPEFQPGTEPKFKSAIFGGEADFTGVHIAANAEFEGAEFKGKVSFNSATIGHLAAFRAQPERNVPAATFRGEVDFIGAHIGSNAEFNGVQFTAADKLVSFDSAKIGGSAIFTGASFAGEIYFDRIHIAAVAAFGGVTFEKIVRFNSAEIDGTAFFSADPSSKLTTFNGGAEFIGTQFRVDAIFDKAHFTAADKLVSFESAKIGGNALFRGASFNGDTRFLSIHACSAVACQGAVFKQNVSFNGAKIEGAGFFQANPESGLPAATFGGVVDFIAAEFGLDAIFDQVQFGATDKQVSFERAKVAGNTWFRGARFAGPVTFRAIEIRGDAFFRVEPTMGITAPTFEGTADFADAKIGSNAEFDRVEFKGGHVSFENANIGSNANFRGATFVCSASFQNVHVGNAASYQGAVFKQKVSFNSAKIEGAMFFRPYPELELPAATFEGGADFIGVRIASDADFNAAQFTGVDKAVQFDGAQIGGNAFFRDSHFAGPVSFIAAKISGWALFVTTQFNNPTSFETANIGGNAFFSNSQFLEASRPSFIGVEFRQGAFFQAATFHDQVDFSRAHFGAEARFDQIRFENDVKFDAARFTGAARFIIGDSGQPVTFEQGASFILTDFGSTAEFSNAIFNSKDKPVSFNGVKVKGYALFGSARFAGDTDFIGAHFASEADFRNVEFNQVWFEHARFERDALFQGAVFWGNVNFQESSIRAIVLATGGSSKETKFEGTVDLRGCTYERISGNWSSLIKRLAPYDRQPYTQLEKVFRMVGQDRDADNVYLHRRREESKRTRFYSDPAGWIGDRFYKWGLNYGVRPFRLIGIAIVCLMLGIGTLSEINAAKGKDEKTTPYLGSLSNAFALSLNQFLPVEMPMGSQWKPSEENVDIKIWLLAGKFSLHWPMRASAFATFFLKLPGWILVPLGVAAFTRLLRGKQST